jgi:hypothetical protein
MRKYILTSVGVCALEVVALFVIWVAYSFGCFEDLK